MVCKECEGRTFEFLGVTDGAVVTLRCLRCRTESAVVATRSRPEDLSLR